MLPLSRALRAVASALRGARDGIERVDDGAGTVTYRATHVAPRQSLSLAVTWPAGFVHVSKFSLVSGGQWLLAAPGLLFLFYLVAWFRIGPEPKPGTVVTSYEPPDGLSAAAVRYAVTTGSDGRTFAAVIAAAGHTRCLRVGAAGREVQAVAPDERSGRGGKARSGREARPAHAV